jgi:hypothetical protein
MPMTLIDHIEDLMASDDVDREQQSDYLRSVYENADPQGRDALDSAFIALCGYSLTTLLVVEGSPLLPHMRSDELS